MTSHLLEARLLLPLPWLRCVVFLPLLNIEGVSVKNNKITTTNEIRNTKRKTAKDMSSSDEQRRIGIAWQMPGNGTRETGETGENGLSGSPSGSSPTSRRGSEHDDLLHHEHTNVWHTDHDRNINHLYQPPSASTTTSPLNTSTFQPPPPLPVPTTTNPNPHHPEAADSDPDSDFELVDSNTPLQTDGNNDRKVTPYKYIPTALRQRPATRSTRDHPKPQDQWDDDEDWPATAGAKNTMEGDNEYDQPEWNQAGPHADAQDLAGPGEHGLLQCTVTKPQKEGEGTQNLYVSYLVTTDVCTLPLED
jgi:hypothetical protein